MESGLKRKRTLSSSDEVANSGQVSLEQDLELRRRVLDLSLTKMRTGLPLTRSLRRREPALLRSVLILNILRSMEPARPTCHSDDHPDSGCHSDDCSVIRPSTVAMDDDDLDIDQLLPLSSYDRCCLRLALVSDDLVVPSNHTQPDNDPVNDPVLGSSSLTTPILDFDSVLTVDKAASLPVLTFSSMMFDIDFSSIWPPPPPASLATSLLPLPTVADATSCDMDNLDFDSVMLMPGGEDFVLSSVQSTTCTHRNELLPDELELTAGILVGT